MSSYLLIRIINKKKYEEYLNKYRFRSCSFINWVITTGFYPCSDENIKRCFSKAFK